jgi:hypothetical protein
MKNLWIILLFLTSVLNSKPINLSQMEKIKSIRLEARELENQNRPIKVKQLEKEAEKIMQNIFKAGSILEFDSNCPLVKESNYKFIIISCVSVEFQDSIILEYANSLEENLSIPKTKITSLENAEKLENMDLYQEFTASVEIVQANYNKTTFTNVSSGLYTVHVKFLKVQ